MSIKAKSKRNSGIELLRIISMAMIFTHHFSVHSGVQFEPGVLTASKILMDVLAAFGKIGVDIFLVISCFYLIESKSIKLKKVVLFILEVVFYSLLMYFLSILLGYQFKVIDLIKSSMPFLFGFYWFSITYIGLYIVSPFLNTFICSLDRKNFEKLLIISTIFFVVTPTFTSRAPEYSNLIWFIYMYFIMGYIKSYNDTFISQVLENNAMIIGIGMIVFLLSSVLIFNYLGIYITPFFYHSAYFSSINKIPAVVISLSLFFTFKNLNINYNKIITYIAKSVFAVYLVHDNNYFSDILWNRIVLISEYINSPMKIIYMLVLSGCIIFIISIIIDKIRIGIFERLVCKLYDLIESKLLNSKFNFDSKTRIRKNSN